VHFQVSDYLLSAVAYGGMGIAIVIGRGILLGLSEDVSTLLKRKAPPPLAKPTARRRVARFDRASRPNGIRRMSPY
jgi:hypothetical protein